ncbi:hypothetical protein [Desulfuromonas sp. TF]|uniref:hypothetical protein n=1 Tax=Desulfuromonas sp. TF TaxID=1232410 RepID=UPI000404CDF2|nr:hypothetical protein [Desulfuromonas sp. TF]
MSKFVDRVKETTNTTGTGAFTLAGAVTAFRSFASALSTGDIVPYVIEAANGSDWETGFGTFTAGPPDTLARTIVTASSNGGSAIDLAAGTHEIYVGLHARSAKPVDYNSPVAITAASVLTSDAAGRHHVCSDSGSPADYEVDLPTSGMSVGDLISIEMSAALTKIVTIDAGAGGSLIDGERYRAMWAKEKALLKWDGTNWQKIAGLSVPQAAKISYNEGPATLVNGATTFVPLKTLVFDTAGLSNLTDGWLTIRRGGRYRASFQGLAQALSGHVNGWEWNTRLHVDTVIEQSNVFPWPAPGTNSPIIETTSYLDLDTGQDVALYVKFTDLVGAEEAKIVTSGNTFLVVEEIPEW